MDEMDDLNSSVFAVDRIHLDELEIRVGRQDENTWWWQVLYIGTPQVQGITHDSEQAAWNRARSHRDLWIEHELESIRQLKNEDEPEEPTP